ncbi:MAG TPA: anti-sigma factor [Burkholderiales bacterium]|nr:anti-sigma factor [Burkholderiales bacterium]
MKLADPKLREMLAGEYALGALHGRARARFERMLRTDADLSRLVGEWQEDLAPLAQEARAVEPAPHVLAAIERRIEGGGSPQARPSLWNRLGFWRTFSFGAATIAAVLAVFTSLLALRAPPSVAPSYVAILQNPAGQPALVVTGYRAPFHLKTEPIVLPRPAEGRVLQIWAIEKDTGAIRPLAVARADAPAQVALSDEAWKLVRGAQSLAVSVEPSGATPSAPTTPLIYSGLCINLKGG